MPLPPYLAEGSCIVPRGQLWRPSGCPSALPRRLPPAGWLLPPAQWLLCWFNDPQNASQGSLRGVASLLLLLFSAAGYQCTIREKVVFPEMESWLVHQSVMLAGGVVTTDPEVAKMVPPTLFLMNWLVPSAPANQGRFPSDWILKDPARFPTRTGAGQWLKPLMGM